MQIDLFIPCYVDQFYPETGMNMVRVLEKLGCKVNYNTEQTCCGMAAYNAGYRNHAKEVGEKFIREFTYDRPAVCPSGACAGMIRQDYTRLFHNSVLHNQCKTLQKNLFEFTEFVHEKLHAEQHHWEFKAKVVYMDACQALRVCRIAEAPRELLRRIQGLELLELPEQDMCCGFGGIYSVKNEEESVALGLRKLRAAEESGAQYIVSTDTSCLMHLESLLKRRPSSVQVMHIADLLAKSIR